MREFGTLIWVVLLIIGVVTSMVSSVRRQVRAQQGRQSPERLTASAATKQPVQSQPLPVASPYRPVPAPAPQRAAPPTAHAAQEHPAAVSEPRAARRRLFASKNELVRAVIAAEVLGKPRALSDEYLTR